MLLFLDVLTGVDTFVAGIAAIAFLGCGVRFVLAVAGLHVVASLLSLAFLSQHGC